MRRPRVMTAAPRPTGLLPQQTGRPEGPGVTSTGTARRADHGMTLVELAVASAVGILLLALIALLFTGAVRSVETVSVRSESVGNARIALESMSRTIRVAVVPTGASAAVVSASPSGISFWALLDRSGQPSDTEPAPTFVSYRYDGQCLTQTMTPLPAGSTGAVPPAPGSAGCLLRTSRPPVFTYYPVGAGAPALPAAPQLVAADLAKVGSVNVVVQVQDPAHQDV